MTETIDYEKLLEQLRAEREELDQFIALVERRAGLAHVSLSLPTESNGVKPAAKPAGRVFRGATEDAFFRMTVADAIKSLLGMVGRRPQTAIEITEGLKQGGLGKKAKNFYQTVYPTLLRMEKDEKVVRVGDGKWGLPEWYPPKRGSDEVS